MLSQLAPLRKSGCTSSGYPGSDAFNPPAIHMDDLIRRVDRLLAMRDHDYNSILFEFFQFFEELGLKHRV